MVIIIALIFERFDSDLNFLSAKFAKAELSSLPDRSVGHKLFKEFHC